VNKGAGLLAEGGGLGVELRCVLRRLGEGGLLKLLEVEREVGQRFDTLGMAERHLGGHDVAVLKAHESVL